MEPYLTILFPKQKVDSHNKFSKKKKNMKSNDNIIKWDLLFFVQLFHFLHITKNTILVIRQRQRERIWVCKNPTCSMYCEKIPYSEESLGIKEAGGA